MAWLLTFGAGMAVARDEFRHATEQYDQSADKEQVWQEDAVSMPAFPLDTDLLAMKPAPEDTVKVFVDRRSVSRGKDGVLRFVLMVESAEGARSVFYDGLRCATREYKTFAVGTLDRQFSVLSGARWQAIRQQPLNGYRYQLYKHYACGAFGSARAPQDFIDALKP